MASKTREKLIDVARQLFVHKGLENTTMNDIAVASDKGRRTIYTYFKNKREIYNAVLEQESEKLVGRLRQMVNTTASSEEKLRIFIMTRLEHGYAIGSSYTSIKSLFKFDIRRLERVRRLVYDKEHDILMEILNEGVANGTFKSERCEYLEAFLIKSIQGLSLTDIEPEDSDEMQDIYAKYVDFIITDILR
jgi:AcrR family transcriptional regulator